MSSDLDQQKNSTVREKINWFLQEQMGANFEKT